MKHLYLLFSVGSDDCHLYLFNVAQRFSENIVGYRIRNLCIFVSETEITEINQFVEQTKPGGFHYFLFDMTNNMEKETFRGFITKSEYPDAKVLVDLLYQFRKNKDTKLELPDENEFNKVLDKINQFGIEKLTDEDRKVLELYSNKK